MASTQSLIPVSVIVVTKNAASILPQCLAALAGFDEVIVVDSKSHDRTKSIARNLTIDVVPFQWNGQYPKKRQWVLDHVPTRHKWILFVDADEIVTMQLMQEISEILNDPKHSAYFIKGQPIFCHQSLGHGRWNNKIVLFKRSRVHYPEFPDADIAAMGEMEGHYQPVVQGSIGQLRYPMIHKCAETMDEWIDRHQRYATWQAEIEMRGIDLAVTESGMRGVMKRAFQWCGGRAAVAFLDSYIVCQGFRDGMVGLHYAIARGWYYWLIAIKKCAILNKAKASFASTNASSGSL
jgi:Glycosyl transferase family 2